jgi:Kef-type K+ transport system membrane component KefB
MARAGALALVLALVAGLAHVVDPGAGFRATPLAIGVALVSAALAGGFIERLGLPRVTGYLLFGLFCGPYVADIITRPMARELQIVNGLAVTLIAFVAGLEMNVRRLAPRLKVIARLSGVTIALTYAVTFAALWLAWPWLGIADGFAGLQRAAAAALLTALVASFSPTVSIAVVAEARAAGPFTELALAVVIIADLVLILSFTMITELVRYAFGVGGGDVALVTGVAWEVLGSLSFGALCGALLSVYLVFVGREIAVAILVFCAILSGAAAPLHMESLLAALAAGMIVENVTPAAGDLLKQAVERSSLPVLVVFFAAAGASLELDAVAALGWTAVAIAAGRTAVVWAAARAGRRAAGLDDAASALTWMTLVSQAGVTLGLTFIVAAEFPTWGARVQTLMLALIAVHQLAGPVLFRHALTRAGEVGRMDAIPGAPIPSRAAKNTGVP